MAKGALEYKKLCIELAKSESEQEVIDVLIKSGFWNDHAAWMDYDGHPGNYSTIGNQQSSADAALVEKIINSVDAVLMRECLRKNISPDGPDAPRSITDAQKQFFGIREGDLSSIDATRRTEIAQNILLVATGKKSSPCYSIIDRGEGQTPARIPTTFLALNKTGKRKIPFVQGKFGMGSGGALQFCSKQYNLQLIISRRDPQIRADGKDKTHDYWGFTIIRRFSPSRGGQMERASSFRYLAPLGKILMFEAPSLPLLPEEHPQAYGRSLEFGTYVKLYEYQLTGYKTNIEFDLYNRLSMLMPGVALPIRLMERRAYEGHTLDKTLAGLNVRIEEDKRENLEQNFPSSSQINILEQEMTVSISAFKKDKERSKREKYSKNDGVIFAINGQAHGFLPEAFFERKACGMSYLKDSVLVLVDCSKFDVRTVEDLFMNSRDRLREGSTKNEIEKRLEEIISTHVGLKMLRDRRREEEIQNRIQDDKPLVAVIESIIRKSPALAKLFIEGVRLRNPFGLVAVNTRENFDGIKFPSYFKLSKTYPERSPKLAPEDQRFRIQCETDAENEYFSRVQEPGKFSIKLNGGSVENFSLNLWSGLATLSVSLPEGVKDGDLLYYEAETMDNSRAEPFRNEFYVRVEKAQEHNGGKSGKRKPPPNGNNDGDRKIPARLSLPNIIELRKAENISLWFAHFKEEADALSVKDAGEGGYDFFLNMDNVYLQTEIRGNPKVDCRLLEKRFKSGMLLIGISLLDYWKKYPQDREGRDVNRESSMLDKVFATSKAIAPILLPMIASLGDLEE